MQSVSGGNTKSENAVRAEKTAKVSGWNEKEIKKEIIMENQLNALISVIV